MLSTRHILGAGVLAGLLARPRLRNWGATLEDRLRVLPGDDLVPGERGICTMVVHIAAPPPAIWPWLAQMGTDRAGWYSFDHLDNGGRPSSDQINFEWVHVAEGDRMTTVPGKAWFDVAHVEPCRSLVLRAPLDLLGRPYDPAGRRPRRYIDARWEFFLDPQADGSTKLLVRSGAASSPRALTTAMNWLFWHPAHVIMQLRQFRELRHRAEGLRAAMGSGELRREVTANLR